MTTAARSRATDDIWFLASYSHELKSKRGPVLETELNQSNPRPTKSNRRSVFKVTANNHVLDLTKDLNFTRS